MRLDPLKGLTPEQLAAPIANYLEPMGMVFDHKVTVNELLQTIQGTQCSQQGVYFYVIDEAHRLQGVLSKRDLLFSAPHTALKDIAHRNIVYIEETTSLEVALKVLTKHELLALPILDEQHHLTGIFEISSILRDHEKDALKESNGKSTRDVFQLIGLSVEQGKITSSIQEFRYRMPWLMCNLIAGVICAVIASSFEGLLHQQMIIATFIPLVLTLGESVAMQSMTLSLQFLQYQDIPWKMVFKRIFIELKTAFLIGVTCAVLMTIVYLFLYTAHWPVLAIGGSIFASMIVVTTFGSLLPIILHALALDPKVASGPVVLMLTDVAVMTIYLGLSNWLLT